MKEHNLNEYQDLIKLSDKMWGEFNKKNNYPVEDLNKKWKEIKSFLQELNQLRQRCIFANHIRIILNDTKVNHYYILFKNEEIIVGEKIGESTYFPNFSVHYDDFRLVDGFNKTDFVKSWNSSTEDYVRKKMKEEIEYILLHLV